MRGTAHRRTVPASWGSNRAGLSGRPCSRPHWWAPRPPASPSSSASTRGSRPGAASSARHRRPNAQGHPNGFLLLLLLLSLPPASGQGGTTIARVLTLSQRSQTALEVVALAGARAEIDLVDALLDGGLADLDEALHRGLVAEADG